MKRASSQVLLPFLMSPRWTTVSTPGSSLTAATRRGKAASCWSPYGVSPMIASVRASRLGRGVEITMKSL